MMQACFLDFDNDSALTDALDKMRSNEALTARASFGDHIVGMDCMETCDTLLLVCGGNAR